MVCNCGDEVSECVMTVVKVRIVEDVQKKTSGELKCV